MPTAMPPLVGSCLLLIGGCRCWFTAGAVQLEGEEEDGGGEAARLVRGWSRVTRGRPRRRAARAALLWSGPKMRPETTRRMRGSFRARAKGVGSEIRTDVAL
jgi:hypothetical protein